MIEIPALLERVAMSGVTLPPATGDSGALTCRLKPEVPGLNSTASTRVLSGIIACTAADTGDGTAARRFTITVQSTPPPLLVEPAPPAAGVASGTCLFAMLREARGH